MRFYTHLIYCRQGFFPQNYFNNLTFTNHFPLNETILPPHAEAHFLKAETNFSETETNFLSTEA